MRRGRIMPGDRLLPVTMGAEEIERLLQEQPWLDEGNHILGIDPREYESLGNGGYRRRPHIPHDD